MSASLPTSAAVPSLRTASRCFPWATGLGTVGELAVLLLAGATAALASVYVDFNLRIPGSSILKVFLPISLGLALAPRRGAGLTMSTGALATLGVLRVYGQTRGVGSMASLLALGPLLDLFLINAKPGWFLYVRFALAGLATNLVAFAIRGGRKAVGWDALAMRPLDDWLTVAPVTYAACGLVAGLACGLILFRWSSPRRENER